jgi:AcrR family transcriptional regulator
MNTWQEQLADARTGLRHAIQEAAVRLVGEHGMPNVSMSAVAEAAGVSRQTLYNHYPDLESIVLEAARTEIDLAQKIITDVVDTAPDAAVALDTYVRGTLSSPTRNEIVISGAGMSPEREAEILEMLEPIHQNLRKILRRGVDEGSFRADVVPEDVSEVLFHMIGSGRRLIHMGRDSDEIADTISGLVLRSVSS